MNKLGLHITNLMLVIRDTEEKPFIRELALEELKKLSEDIGSFIFEYIDEIEELNNVVPEGYDEDEANQRMDIIGQNGPTGDHYDKNQTELEL
tara:strand:+ start:1758 stop:2036 length:279 start_codon:yes stop_codon:yes gene_type:complete